MKQLSPTIKDKKKEDKKQSKRVTVEQLKKTLKNKKNS